MNMDNTVNRFIGKKVVITGASSGIGFALASHFLKLGAIVVAAASRDESLSRLKPLADAFGSRCILLSQDLRHMDKLPAFAKMCIARAGGIDIFVANAGMSQRSFAEETDIQVMTDLLTINYTSQIILTRLFLDHMIAQQSGVITAVSSIAGILGTPLRTSYGGSKAAQLLFYEALSHEVYNRNIFVNVVVPGFVKTGISINARTGNGSAYGEMDPNQEKGISPEKAAELIIRGIAQRKPRVYPGLTVKARLALFLNGHVPWLYSAIIRKTSVV